MACIVFHSPLNGIDLHGLKQSTFSENGYQSRQPCGMVRIPSVRIGRLQDIHMGRDWIQCELLLALRQHHLTGLHEIWIPYGNSLLATNLLFQIKGGFVDKKVIEELRAAFLQYTHTAHAHRKKVWNIHSVTFNNTRADKDGDGYLETAGWSFP